VPLMVQEDMTQRSISRADAVLAIEDGEYNPAEVLYVAYALLLYVRDLRAAHAEATGDKARYEEQLKNHTASLSDSEEAGTATVSSSFAVTSSVFANSCDDTGVFFVKLYR
jgi:hypothetical protein